MATSAEAWFGLVTANEEGRPISGDIAYDNQGNCTTSAADALHGALRVFDRSYKGSHLALIVELLAGALCGASMGEDKWKAENWGSLVIVIDPTELGAMEDFRENVEIMCQRVKNAKKLSGVSEICLPGERSERIFQNNMSLGTLEIDDEKYERLVALATSS